MYLKCNVIWETCLTKLISVVNRKLCDFQKYITCDLSINCRIA